jgi:hypothetical protein
MKGTHSKLEPILINICIWASARVKYDNSLFSVPINKKLLNAIIVQ